jgi:hypothetical protein
MHIKVWVEAEGRFDYLCNTELQVLIPPDVWAKVDCSRCLRKKQCRHCHRDYYALPPTEKPNTNPHPKPYPSKDLI